MAEYIDFKFGKEIEWLELNLLKTKRPLSKSDITRFSGVEQEDIVDSWIQQLKDRIPLFNQEIYTIKDNRITPNLSWEEIPEYFLCLYYSYNGANDNSGGTKLFEKISALTLKNFIDGDIYTLGFPTGKGFNEYLDDLTNVCNENRNMPANSSYKDDGVDVVGYKLFEDSRGANLYVLLQCAAGTHWATKKQISLNRWTNYIVWYPENIIQSISTVEYVSKKDWDKRTSTYGMLIDRIRIFNFLYKETVEIGFRTEVKEWCRQKIDNGI